MQIIEVDTTDRKEVKKFIELPFSIYRTIPQWVPPLEGDLIRSLDRNKNPYYHHSQALFLLAMQSDGTPVGRLAILNNHRYNDFNHEKTAFFSLFECPDNQSIAHQLFETGIEWAKKQELNKMIGPKGFTALDGLGMLILGFEHRPAFGIPYNPAYYPKLIEQEKFIKITDIVSGHMYSERQFPPKIHEISKLVQERKGLHVERFKTRADLMKLVPKLKDLYNGALQGTSGNVPLTNEEARTMANQILWFADPRFIKILMKGKEPVGFLFAYPDISQAVQRQKGKLFPLGWWDIFREMQRTDWVDINGAGILEQYRGMGGTAILFSEMYYSVLEGHFKHADLVQIGVENDRMLNELRDMGIEFYKVHRLYQKELV
jgi:hypothetical protein